ncbi:MAG: RuBisCO large subunit C-terminal-like domain-containing protein, partial [Candidatus Nanohaloarchaea archaeon]|nr:RuBisCO large subunit C-terminal-like domain-containing protein [Candidatus Nanohaloarchaea archaeon]
PGILPKLVDRLGTNIAIQVGGGVHGHPDGSAAGARALHQAIDAVMDDV